MKKIFYIPIVLFLLIILNSCEEQKMKKLQGRWELVNFSEDTTNILQYQYGFQTEFAQQKIICYQNGVPKDSGEYMLETKFDITYIVFSNLQKQYLVYDGKWIVAELKKDVLVLLTGEYKGQSTREFFRVE